MDKGVQVGLGIYIQDGKSKMKSCVIQ